MLHPTGLLNQPKLRRLVPTLRICLFGGLLALRFYALPPQAHAAQEPYIAYVNADEVYVRSGPGKNYYPTQKLERGEQVEVYRHDPGGWYAIRPPRGSYSWVSGEFIKADDAVATVIGERVVARVGSDFSDVRDVIQVRLNRGEEIEVLDKKEFNPGPAAQTWYKIAPPPGEFRWIHGRFISQQLEEPQLEETGPGRNLLVPPDGISTTDDEPMQSTDLEGGEVALAEHREGVEDAMPVPKGNVSRSPRRTARDNAPLEAANPAPQEDDSLDHEVTPTRVAQRNAPRNQAPVLSRAEGLSQQLANLDLELSAMVAEEPSAWSFDDLLLRANAALDQGETAIERGRVRVLIHKIERFADLKRRLDAVNQVTAETDRLNRPYSSLRSGYGAPRDDYDGVGRLARVQTARGGVPAYALTDSSGAIRYFVTPAPGVNLRHYLGQEVGISGNVGYAPDLEHQNVTARRITVLGDQTLRR